MFASVEEIRKEKTEYDKLINKLKVGTFVYNGYGRIFLITNKFRYTLDEVTDPIRFRVLVIYSSQDSKEVGKQISYHETLNDGMIKMWEPIDIQDSDNT